MANILEEHPDVNIVYTVNALTRQRPTKIASSVIRPTNANTAASTVRNKLTAESPK